MRYLCIIILSVLSVFVWAQDTTFNILLNSNVRTKEFRSIIKIDSNYYLLYSTVNLPPIEVGIGLINLNNSFQVLDSSLYSNSSYYSIINSGKGFELNKIDTTFMVAGAVQFPSNQKQNGYLVKFNKDLDTIWTKQISHPDTAYADTAQTPWVTLRDVAITPEGHYLIVGNYNYHCQGNMDNSFIMKMDTAGNNLWQKFLDPAIHLSYITNIEIDPIDSGFYFVSSNYGFYLYKYDKDGDYVWSKLFYSGNRISWATDIKLIGDNVIVGCNYIIFSGDTPRLQVASINRNSHSINWIRKFNNISVLSQYLRQEVIDIEVISSNKFVVGTTSLKYKDSHFSDERANLLIMNTNGDSLWSHYYAYQNDSTGVEDMQFNDMVVCDDGGILFGGSYYSYPLDPQYIRAWLVKTDSMGNAPGMFTVGIEEEELIIKNLELKIFPNPTPDNLNLVLQENPKEELQLEIYSISGQLVLEKQLPAFEKEHRINIQDLPSGVYSVKLMSDSQVVYSGKIIKE